MDHLIIAANRSILDFKKEDLEARVLSGFGSGGLAQAMLGLLREDSNFHPIWIGSAGGKADKDVVRGAYDNLFQELKHQGIAPYRFPLVEREDDNVLRIRYQDYDFRLVKIFFMDVIMEGYYNLMSNSFLWGLMHYDKKLLHRLEEYTRPRVSEQNWLHYASSNYDFNHEIIELLEKLNKRSQGPHNAVVWNQDYHTLLAPINLRGELLDNPFENLNVRIGHFIHTPYPDPSILDRYFKEISLSKILKRFEEGLPDWTVDLLKLVLPPHYNTKYKFVIPSLAMLGNDFIGFHIPRYVQNYANLIDRHADMLPMHWEDRRIESIDEIGTGHFEIRHTRSDIKFKTVVGAYPIGVDGEKILRYLKDGSPLEHEFSYDGKSVNLNELIKQNRNRGVYTFGGLERLDFTKGVPYKLQIFEEFLKISGNAQLVQISEPSRKDSPAYINLGHILEREVQRINNNPKLSWLGYTPIIHDEFGIGQPDNYRFIRDVDVLMVTPYSDGMNLVILEGILSKKYLDYGKRGIIVVGNCGASEVLENYDLDDGIVRVDGLNPKQAARKIKYALDNRKYVSDRVIEFVEKKCNVKDWAAKNIHSIKTGEYLGFKQAA